MPIPHMLYQRAAILAHGLGVLIPSLPIMLSNSGSLSIRANIVKACIPGEVFPVTKNAALISRKEVGTNAVSSRGCTAAPARSE